MVSSVNPDKGACGAIWVLCEVSAKWLLPVSLELPGCARSLSEKRGNEVWAVLPGCGVSHLVQTLWEHGTDAVLAIDDPLMEGFNDEDQAPVLSRLIGRYSPETILAGATAAGRALAPRIAILRHSGLTADCTGLDIDPESEEP